MTTESPEPPRRSTSREVATTRLRIERPTDFTLVEREYQLVRYTLPDELFYSAHNSSQVFGRVQNALRDQLSCAYKSYQYDTLDGPRRWAVYALYPRNVEPEAVVLSWPKSVTLPHRSIACGEAPFHIQVKLFQIAVFRGDDAGRFVGQDACFAYARPAGGDFHYCVHVEVQGARETSENDTVHEFAVIPHVKRFGTAVQPYRSWETLYGKRPQVARFVFLHLRSEAVEREAKVYHEVRIPDRRAHLKYHDLHDIEASRGKILADFLQQFLAFLHRLGISGTCVRRNVTRFKPHAQEGLDLSRLGTVAVYDNRLARERWPMTAYVEVLATLRHEIQFVPADQITDSATNGPDRIGWLVLLDAAAEDFADGGLLAGQDDPYQALYRASPQAPKQSIIINPNDRNALNGLDFLEYPLVQPDADLALRLEVALTELYLKCAVAYGYELFPLPLPADEGQYRAYIQKRWYEGDVYTTALWFADGQLRFADLGDPTARSAFEQLARQWGVDYGARFEEYLEVVERGK